MKRGLVLILPLAMAAALLGCEGDGNKGPAGQAVIAEADLAVAVDFEEEAAKSISPANYKAELDSLEKEISAE